MPKYLAISALFAALAFGAVGEAGAWERNTSTTGPRGQTVTGSHSGSCANGSCSGSSTATGPQGQTVTGSRNGSCANGSCSGSSTATGPRGQSITRNRSFSR